LCDAAGTGGLTVREIAPGVDLERDVLAQSEFPLLVSPQLKTMDANLFHPEPIRLQAASGNGGAAMSPFVQLSFDGPLARLTLKARRQAQCARSGHDPRAG
jgi:Acyl CoA:acetate/3-ketoacid CoA transferase